MTDLNPNDPTAAGGWQALLEIAKGRLGRQTLGTLVLQVGSMGLTFLVALVLGRILGADGFGAYALAVAWIQILLIPGLLGLNSLTFRETARLQELDPGATKSYVRWSTRVVLGTSLAAATIGGGAVVALQSSQAPEVVIPQLIALALLPLVAVSRIWQSVLIGIGRVIAGQLPESLLVPVSILVGAAVISLGPWELTPSLSVLLRVVGVGAAAGVLWLVMQPSLPAGRPDRLARATSRTLLRSAFALGLTSAVFLVVTRTDVVMLGLLSDLESVGSYTVALRGAELAVFPFKGFEIVLAPTVASLFAAQHLGRLQRILTVGFRGAVFAMIPIVVALVLFGDLYLGLFGEQFAEGLAPLRILTIGFLFAGLTGSTGLIVMMTGHEVVAAKVVGAAAILNLLLNLALIPPFGAVGAAVATAVSQSLWTAMLAIWIRRNLHLDSTVLGLIPAEAVTARRSDL